MVPMLMLQLAIPSDLASYVFGLVRCRFIIFAGALALAEVPYALGAVYLGASFLQARILPLLVLGLAGVLLSVWAAHQLHDVLRPPDMSASLREQGSSRAAGDRSVPRA